MSRKPNISADAAELRRRAEERLKRQRPQRTHDELGLRVQERTAELTEANEALRIEIIGHERAEEALRAREEQMRFVSDHAPVFLAHCDHERRYKFVNQPYAEMFGLRPADIIGRHPRDVLGEEAYAQASSHMEAVLAGQPTEYDVVLPATPSGRRTVRARYVPERDASGRVVGFIAAILDITERKRAEQEIQDLSKFPSENPNPVLRIARDGTLLYINEAGLSLLPQWHLEVGHASPPLLREAVFQSVDNGSTHVLDLEHGEQVYSFFVAPIVAARYANLYGREITERKQAEVALRDSRNMLQTVLDSIPSAVFWKDRDSIYLGGNRSWLEAAGLKSSEGAVGKSDYDLPWEKEQADSFREHDRRVIESGIPEYDIIEPYLRGDSTHAWAKTNKVPLRDTEGNVVGVLGTYEDITERRRAEERMRTFSHEIIAAREEERKQVSSVLHHDVGSLAVGLSAHLDAIEDDLRSGKPGEALKWMKRTRKALRESVARLKGVAVQLRPPELDAVGLRAALRQHFSQVTKRGGARIHFRETLGRRRVSGDTATTLFRIAQETLTNAVTHGDAKQVDVFLSASKREVKLTVRDNGKGFSPSGQTGQATSRMGLRVMKEMAVFAGGAFVIDSGRKKGTTVRVSLPLTTAPLRPGDVTVQKETVARGKTTRSAGRGSRPQKGSGA